MIAGRKGTERETLLDDLLRAASRDPKRLESVRHLIEDLGRTGRSSTVIPADFLAVWNAVEEAISSGESA